MSASTPRRRALTLTLCALSFALSACSSTPATHNVGSDQPTEHVNSGDRFNILSGLPGDGPIAVRVIRAGQGQGIRHGQTAVVHYTGRFADGRKFDSSRDKDKPFRVELGAGKVIRGWELILARMHVGDQWKVMIPYELAYGDSGRGPIPPMTNLLFEMELLAVE